MYDLILLLHLLGATVWTGGHLVLAVAVLPRVLRTGDLEYLKTFESGFEKLGIPALIVQITSGIYLGNRMVQGGAGWFDFSDPVSKVVAYKILLLLATAALALDARLRIIPNLSERNLVSLAYHIIPVSIISVLFVVVGASFRSGWLY